LTLKHYELLSNFAFKFILRRYNKELVVAALGAGAYTRPLLSSTSVILVSEPIFLQFVTSYVPYIY
jgi:hypothetical protein